MVTTFLAERDDRRRMITELARVYALRERAASVSVAGQAEG